jgi:hypothetical protein
MEPQPLKRFLKPRDGHTARRKGARDEDPSVLRYSRPEIRIDPKTVAVATTVVDEVLSNLDAYYERNWRNQSDIPLDKNHMWESVEATLRENAVKVWERRERDQFEDKRAIEYTLPVTGEQIIHSTLPKKKYNHERYFYFKGHKYDMTMIYYSRSKHKFESYGRYSLLDPVPNTKAIYGKLRIRGVHSDADIRQSFNGNYYYHCGSRNPWERTSLPKFEGKVDSINVDFGKDTVITHLVTMGRALYTNSFPYYKEEYEEYQIPKNYRLTYILEKENHCITKFEVQYRKHSSKQWISLGEFTGNADRLTQVRHVFETPITAQYFRIIPKVYNSSPSIQFAFYTPSPTSERTSTELADTVTYTIIHPSERRYYSSYWNYKDRYGDTSHRTKRTQNRAIYHVKNMDAFTDEN